MRRPAAKPCVVGLAMTPMRPGCALRKRAMHGALCSRRAPPRRGHRGRAGGPRPRGLRLFQRAMVSTCSPRCCSCRALEDARALRHPPKAARRPQAASAAPLGTAPPWESPRALDVRPTGPSVASGCEAAALPLANCTTAPGEASTSFASAGLSRADASASPLAWNPANHSRRSHRSFRQAMAGGEAAPTAPATSIASASLAHRSIVRLMPSASAEESASLASASPLALLPASRCRSHRTTGQGTTIGFHLHLRNPATSVRQTASPVRDWAACAKSERAHCFPARSVSNRTGSRSDAPKRRRRAATAMLVVEVSFHILRKQDCASPAESGTVHSGCDWDRTPASSKSPNERFGNAVRSQFWPSQMQREARHSRSPRHGSSQPCKSNQAAAHPLSMVNHRVGRIFRG